MPHLDVRGWVERDSRSIPAPEAGGKMVKLGPGTSLRDCYVGVRDAASPVSSPTVSTGSRPSPSPGVSVVLPVYEEALNLPRILPRIGDVLREIRFAYEILVVDDASPDGSASVSRRVARARDLPVLVVERTGARSLAGAVVEGAQKARHSCVVVLDADLSHDPRCLPLLVEEILADRVDVAIGSRYVEGGRIASWTARRRAMSWLGTWLARRISGVGDPLSGFFAARRELLDGSTTPLKPRGYKILLEILGRNPALRVKEVPIEFRDRRLGESKFRFREKKEFLVQVSELVVARLLRSLARGLSSRRAAIDHAVRTGPRAGDAPSPSRRERSERAERCRDAEA